MIINTAPSTKQDVPLPPAITFGPPPPITASLSHKGPSARPHRRPRCRVARRDRIVDVDQDARICGRVGAGEADEGARLAGAGAAGDGELGAGEVELGAADCAGAVQGDVLDAEEVVAVRERFRDRDADGCVAWENRVS